MITPPPELSARLLDNAPFRSNQIHERDRWLIQEAYKAGADHELKACCQWLSFYSAASDARDLRTARRPKPPSLKEQALDALNLLLMFMPPGDQREQGETIRRALEALDD